MSCFLHTGGDYMKKLRKKGQAFIDTIIVLPIMLISTWLILQMIVFVYANNQVDNAADNGAILVAQQLRGTTDKLDVISNQDQIVEDLFIRLDQSLNNNGFILFSKDSSNNSVTLDNYSVIIENKEGCQTDISNRDTKRVLCVYTDSINVNGRNHDQMIVRVKVPFKIIGNFIPGIEDNIFLHGNGAATKEISGRFQYY